NDLEQCGWNGSFAGILIRCGVTTISRYLGNTLFGDQNHFRAIELQREKRRVGVEQLGHVLELEWPIRGEVNENVSSQFLTGQHCENDRLSSRLDAVQVRAVTCELHGHARKGWAGDFAR